MTDPNAPDSEQEHPDGTPDGQPPASTPENAPGKGQGRGTENVKRPADDQTKQPTPTRGDPSVN